MTEPAYTKTFLAPSSGELRILRHVFHGSFLKSFKCLNFNTSVSSVHLVQLNLLSCHLLGKELLTRLVIFLFDVLDKLWVLIRSVPEVPLLILFGPYQVYLNNTALGVG